MPRAIMLVALIGGGVEDPASAAGSIALQIGGQLFGAVFLCGLVVAHPLRPRGPGQRLRLLSAMGRDSVLPKAVFGRLSEKFHTPVANLVITGIVGLIAIFLDGNRGQFSGQRFLPCRA